MTRRCYKIREVATGLFDIGLYGAGFYPDGAVWDSLTTVNMYINGCLFRAANNEERLAAARWLNAIEVVEYELEPVEIGTQPLPKRASCFAREYLNGNTEDLCRIECSCGARIAACRCGRCRKPGGTRVVKDSCLSCRAERAQNTETAENTENTETADE